MRGIDRALDAQTRDGVRRWVGYAIRQRETTIKHQSHPERLWLSRNPGCVHDILTNARQVRHVTAPHALGCFRCVRVYNWIIRHHPDIAYDATGECEGWVDAVLSGNPVDAACKRFSYAAHKAWPQYLAAVRPRLERILLHYRLQKKGR